MNAKNTVAVVDCGMGNIHSVLAGARRANPGIEARVTSSAAVIDAAARVIFPGDGHFGACMRAIDALGLRRALLRAAREKPFFGICVGMQVLFAASEEAEPEGLGLFDATMRRLPTAPGCKTPHIGWNTARVTPAARAHPWLAGVADNEWFYFVHSYCAPAGNWTLMTCDYGAVFCAAAAQDNLIATQFHPEKSGARGQRLLENFLA